MHTNLFKHSHGRTLVELMVAIAIGLVVTGAVLGIYLSSSQTARVANERSAVEDAGAVAMFLIGNSIRQAGYGEIIGQDSPLGTSDVSVLSRANTLFGENDTHLFACANHLLNGNLLTSPGCAGATNNGFDTLMTRYQGNTVLSGGGVGGLGQGDLRNCVNDNPPSPTHAGYGRPRPMVHNVYFVDNGVLSCSGITNAGAANVEPLVPNVEQFKIFLGFDDTLAATPNASAAQPPTARTIVAPGDIAVTGAFRNKTWDYVVNVHVCLVVRSDDDTGRGLTATAAGANYFRCPRTAAEALWAPNDTRLQETPNDGVIRRTYRQVFTVRSRAASSPVAG